MELRNEPQGQGYSFLMLTEGQRKRFLDDHRGFLQSVVRALAARGIPKSLATVSRTWHGWFIKPNEDVLRELERAYLRARSEDRARARTAAA